MPSTGTGLYLRNDGQLRYLCRQTDQRLRLLWVATPIADQHVEEGKPLGAKLEVCPTNQDCWRFESIATACRM